MFVAFATVFGFGIRLWQVKVWQLFTRFHSFKELYLMSLKRSCIEGLKVVNIRKTPCVIKGLAHIRPAFTDLTIHSNICAESTENNLLQAIFCDSVDDLRFSWSV